MLLTTRTQTRRDRGHLGSGCGCGCCTGCCPRSAWHLWVLSEILSPVRMIWETHLKAAIDHGQLQRAFPPILSVIYLPPDCWSPITDHWSLIPDPRTVWFNVPTRTETENAKGAFGLAAARLRSWRRSRTEQRRRQRQLVVALIAVCFVLSCWLVALLLCCREKSDAAAAAFCLRLCFFWRVSKPRRPRAKFA